MLAILWLPATAVAQPAKRVERAESRESSAPQADASDSGETDRTGDTGDADIPKGPVLVAPRLREFSPAVFPEAAIAEGLMEARVELEMLVAPDGTPSEIRVVGGAGHGFDEAALAAAPGLRFSPAMHDGVAVPARVRYAYVFEHRVVQRTESESDPDLPPPPAALEGRVLSAAGGGPLVGARVTVLGPDDETTVLRTDADGRFEIAQLPAGEYSIAVRARGHVERFDIERLSSGQLTSLVQRLQRLPDPDRFGAVARVAPPPREVTRRSIGRAQLTRIPGTRGDALRTVEILPGVARPPFGAGALIIRGSSPRDSQVQLEGLQVPLLYHFGGLTSFYHSQLLESVEFFPGNFSVRYGRKRGGIVDVNVRDPRADGLHGQADINLLDASVLAEGPIAQDLEFAGAYRRSYLDTVFEALVPPDQLSVIAAPVYYDYQAITTYRPAPRHRLRLMAFGTSDRFEILFGEGADQGAEVTDLDFSTQLHRLQLSWYANLSDNLQHDMELAVGRTEVRFGVGSLASFTLEGTEFYLRSEWRQRVTDRVHMIYGTDIITFPGEVHYRGPQLGADGAPENRADPRNRARQSTDIEFVTFQPALYVESNLHVEPLRVVLGSRVDYFRQIDAFTFDPRLSVHYEIVEGTSLKSGIGIFSQPPQPQEANPDIGNPELRPMRTVHLGGGVDQAFSESVFVGAELFYKHFYDLIVGAPGGQPPFFVNEGEGRAYGLEIAARVEPTGRFFGYLSYTLSRSERKDADGRYRLFNFDQPHILTVAAVYRMGRGWEVGGTFRLVSGNPETPIVGGVLNLDNGNYAPIFGATNSRRVKTFNRLDLRIEKKWSFEAWKLTLYLDIQNVYNANNIEGTTHDYAFRNSSAVGGLPFLPNLGIKGEL